MDPRSDYLRLCNIFDTEGEDDIKDKEKDCLVHSPADHQGEARWNHDQTDTENRGEGHDRHDAPP